MQMGGCTVRPSSIAARAAEVRPAFVVLTVDGTVVIPVNPAIELRVLPGHFVGTVGGPPGVAGHADVDVMLGGGGLTSTIPVCPSGDFGDICELPVDLDDASPIGALASASTTLKLRMEPSATGALRPVLYDPLYELGLDAPCDCLVVHGVSTDGRPEPEFDLSDPDIADVPPIRGVAAEQCHGACAD